MIAKYLVQKSEDLASENTIGSAFKSGLIEGITDGLIINAVVFTILDLISYGYRAYKTKH